MVRELTHEATIAVIDDEESLREGCRQTLDSEGYRTAVAADGEEGLRVVEQLRPKVVLVDLKMPGMDGMEVLERIRKFDPAIIRIVITGYGTIESAVMAMRGGTFDYLTKPFEPEELLAVIARALEQEDAQRRAAALEREKETALNNFAAVVCHQLKSPAAAAAEQIEVLTQELLGPLTEKQKSVLERAYHRVENLTTLIEDWLRLARMEAGTLELEPRRVELPQVIEQAWEALSNEKDRSRIRLELHTAPDVEPVRGEEGLLRDLFANLFSNSIRFTPGPGRVTVKLTRDAENTVVSVSDTGIGIPAEELPHLFEPFYRGARAAVGSAEGAGLGLVIARRIASVHSGTLAASSTPGQGATFTLRLPVHVGVSTVRAAPAAAEAEPTVKVAPRVLDAPQLSSFLDRLIAEQPVAGVQAKGDRFVFGWLQNASELRLDYDVTLLPPKKYLMPQREKLVTFKLGDPPTAAPCVEELEPMALVGVHPYDMIAINQLDRLMLETNPDPNYLARRKSLVVIGVDPARAAEKAFWGAMDCSLVNDGFDLWLTDIGGTYVIEVGTDRGASLLDRYADARAASPEELDARSQLRLKLKEIGTPREVRFRPANLPTLLRGSFAHGLWEEKAQKCLSCGSCNLVCPTCYCFDVKDDVDISLKTGERYRVWDGCVLQDFAKVGTGENFREERFQRYRHRFYRKGMYLYDKYGYIACVGCGRCASVCLPDIADPVGVYNALKEEKAT